MPKKGDEGDNLFCSFCGKNQKEVKNTSDAKVVNLERPIPSQEKKEAKAVQQS